MSILYQLYMALDVCSFLLLKPFTQSFWNYLEYHLCSESLLLQLSVVSPFFDSFNSWLIFSSGIYFILNSFFYPSSCCRFLALHNSLGTIIIEQILKYRYDFFSPIGKSCLKTELQFSDYYCLLAVHVLTDVWRETGKNQ